MLIPPASAKTLQVKHLSLLQLTCLSQRSLLAPTLDHAKAQQGRHVPWPQVIRHCLLRGTSEATGTSEDTALWLSSTHLPVKAWEQMSVISNKQEEGKVHLCLNGRCLPAAHHRAGWLTDNHGRGKGSFDGMDRLCSSRELAARSGPYPWPQGRTVIIRALCLLC